MTPDPAVTAVADQYQAASTDARRYAKLSSQQPDAHSVAQIQDAPPWLAAIVAAHDRAVLAGRARICPHVNGFRVFHVAAWAPGTVACTACAEAGVLDRLATLAQALTCNVCDQPGTVDTMTAGFCQRGPFVIHFGVHHACDWTAP